MAHSSRMLMTIRLGTHWEDGFQPIYGTIGIVFSLIMQGVSLATTNWMHKNEIKYNVKKKEYFDQAKRGSNMSDSEL